MGEVSFSWPGANENTRVCFEAKEGPVLSNGDAAVGETAGKRCVMINLRYRPSMTADGIDCTREDGTNNLKCSKNILVGEETSFTVGASDRNEEDVVTMIIPEDPGLPMGAKLVGDGPPTPGPTSRSIVWTPIAGQQGQHYDMGFVAHDNKKNCQEGKDGWLSEETHVRLTVLDSSTKIVGSFGETHNTAVGCHFTQVIGSSDVNSLYLTEIGGKGAFPEGASFAGETDVALTGSSRVFQWTPSRGQERNGPSADPSGFGGTYDVCFKASDVYGMSSDHGCFTVNVVKCKYCPVAGDSLQSIAKDFGTDWLQLYGANPSIENPDSLSADQINLGPVYRSRQHDTLRSVARRYGTTVETILLANPDMSPSEGTLPIDSPVCVFPGVCENSDYKVTKD